MNSQSKVKKLLPCTVIPSVLYVERDADRQLQANISQMGRPAYILVARQMGKTNLLLNAKRVIENNIDKVVYVDLSSSFSDERECFRRIIDSIIESCGALFESLSKKIEDERKFDRPAAREHDIELRSLLRAAPGKVVIILDEIDSLTNASFSDKIFAHIRSVYFSRVTFSELHKLTYVLSGVVEPNEIIKDKKISPFNIGEKIYLEDFSQNEVNYFLAQAGLDLSAEEIERLYFWTAGNPRMTWDLCSSLEDGIDGIRGGGWVDDCVQDLYLNEFDHAPVDHIRELVRDSAEIRNAVWEIAAGKAERITASTRTKLYLSGIIRSASEVVAPKLKNEIIAKALSLDWLNGLIVEQRSGVNIAYELYRSGDYREAYELLNRYLPTVDKSEVSSATWFTIGVSAYRIGKYNEAVDLLDKCSFDEAQSANLYWDCQSYRGECSVFLGRFDEAIDLLHPFIASGRRDLVALRARVNLCSAYLHRDDKGDSDHVEAIHASINQEFDYQSLAIESPDIVKYYRAGGFYILGKSRVKRESPLEARLAFEQGLDCATSSQLLIFQIELIFCETNSEKRMEGLRSVVQDIITNSIKPNLPVPGGFLSFSVNTSVELLGALAKEGMTEQIDQFIEYIQDHCDADVINASDLLIEAALGVIREETSVSASLFKRCLRLPTRSFERRIRAVSWLVLLQPNSKLVEEYISYFESESTKSVFDVLDVRNFADLGRLATIRGEWTKAVRLMNIADRYRDAVGDNLLCNFIGFDLIRIVSLSNVGRNTELMAVARRGLDLIEKVSSKSNNVLFFSEGDMNEARKTFGDLTSIYMAKGFVRERASKSITFTRNQKVDVRYKNGVIKRGVRYKHVEAELKAGTCCIID